MKILLFWKNLFSNKRLLLIAFSVLGSKLALLFVDLLLANKVGSGVLTDAYVLTMSISTGLLNFVLINIRKITVNELSKSHTECEFNNIISKKILSTLFFFTPLIFLLIFKTDIIIGNIYNGNNPEVVSLMKGLLPIAGFSSVFYIFLVISSSSLDKFRPYVYPASYILQAMCICFGLIIYLKTKEILFFNYSIILGFILQLLFTHFINVYYRPNLFFKFNYNINSLSNLKILAPMLVFQGINEISKIYEKSILSNFDEGTVSFFYYSNKLNISILGIIVTIFTFYYISPLSDLKINSLIIYRFKVRKVVFRSSFIFLLLSIFLYLKSEFIFNNTFNRYGKIHLDFYHLSILEMYNFSGFFYAIIQVVSVLLITNGNRLLAFVPTLSFGVFKIFLIFIFFEISKNSMLIAQIHLFSLIVSTIIAFIIIRITIYSH